MVYNTIYLKKCKIIYMVGWKDQRLKRSYDTDDNFFPNGIQALEHCWKRYVDRWGGLCWKNKPNLVPFH